MIRTAGPDTPEAGPAAAAYPRLRRACPTCMLSLALCVLHLGAAPVAHAQFGERVVEVVVEQEGERVIDPLITRLVSGAIGQPLSMRDIRDTIARLMSLNRFEDVQPHAEEAEDGIRLRYDVVPLHPVDRVEFRGALGLPERELRRVVVDRFGTAPTAGRAAEVADALRAAYRSRGYPQAGISTSIEETHRPDRATLVVQIESGPRAIVRDVLLRQVDPDQTAIIGLPDIQPGQPYDAAAIDRQLDAYVDRMRARGYYEARTNHVVSFDEAGRVASVTVTAERGPRVVVAFSGDPLPANERDRLVPVRAEASADEDLLEDAARAIENYLFDRGYADAQATYTRSEVDGELIITFHTNRGPRHLVDEVQIIGNAAIPDGELEEILRLRRGDSFVRRTLDSGVTAVVNAYRSRGFTQIGVTPRIAVLPPDRDGDSMLRVEVVIDVTEGPQTVVRTLAFEGVDGLDEAELRQIVASRPGMPFSEFVLLGDRDRLDLEYRNRGYESVVVDPEVTLLEGDTVADVRFVIVEGPQIFVDFVIITGNERVSDRTIQRELLLRSGEPLGYSALIESRSRLVALGLFRRVQIEPLAHTSEPRRDVLIHVEEASPNTLGFGGGVEGGFRTRNIGGVVRERLELVPRGFFEVGRRNLWGKNRAVSLFTRVSLRARDVGQADGTEPVDRPGAEGSYGLNEYRVFATYREPRVFGTRADALVTGIFDQAVRTRFSFATREARAELGMRLSPRYSVMARYSVQRTTLFFDESFPEQDRPLIDRLFPQVRLSKFAGSIIRDTRDDLLDPSRGTFMVVDGDLAARLIGSEVGFLKSYVQVFSFRRLPTTRRIVLALGGRVGAARGFPREVTETGDDGEPSVSVVEDLPASERFFAGGDTTVRGFSLDRLGTEQGFPRGGNSVVILNAELRVALFGALQGVTFLDAGNVYPQVSDLDITDLRLAPGFGVWYRSPVGPIRLDLGFNVDRRVLVPGQPDRERGWVLHLSLGPAF